MEEIWIDIKGYNGHFQVSNKGNVRSMPRVVTTKKWKGMPFGWALSKAMF